MVSVHPRHRAVVLSNADLDRCFSALLHSCEDCACEVSRGTTILENPPAVPTEGLWLSGRDIVEIPLTAEYRLLFNPLGHGGVVVVDDAAATVFKRFAQPSTFERVRGELDVSVRDDFDEVSARLRGLQLIEPLGNPVGPATSDCDLGGAPLTAWLHLTNDCNLRCPYCYLRKSDEAMTETTGRAAIAAVIRSAVRHGFPAVKLKYAGGEATMNRHLMLALHAHARTLSAAHGLDLHATLLTNGVALPADLIPALKAEHIKIMISLDGIGELQDVQRPSARGKPSFRRVERTIDRLLECDHRPHLSITVSNLNAAGLADVVRFALDRGLTFSLNFFRDNDRAARFKDLRYSEQTMIAAMLEAFAVVEEFLPPWSVLGSILDRGQLLRPRRHACGVGRDYVVVDQRGRVAPCHMEIERTLGDVFHDDPLALVREDRSPVRNLPVEHKEGCQGCTWRYWCSGGCAVATYRATGRYDVKSPNCAIYRAVYPRALRIEGLRLLKYGLPARH